MTQRSLTIQCLAGLALLFLISGSILAQGYTEVKVDVKLQNDKIAAFNAITSGQAAPNALKDADKFLDNYYLGRWTVFSERNKIAEPGDISKYRMELLDDSSSFSDVARANFNKKISEKLLEFANNNNYSPFCRYNAVLALGELNESDGDPAVPYAPNLDVLTSLFTGKNPDYIRLGALLGLVRHTELGIADPAMEKKVCKIFLAVLDPNTKFAEKAGLQADVAQWFRIKCLEGLAALKKPSGSNSDAKVAATEVLDLMLSVIGNEDNTPEERCVAARALGTLDYSTLQNFDFQPVISALIKLGSSLCQDELNYIKFQSIRGQALSQGGMMSGGDSMMGGMPGSGMSTGGMSTGGMSAGGAGGMSSGGMTGTMMSDEEIRKVNDIIARVKYDIDSIQEALVGPGSSKTGIRAHIDSAAAAQLEKIDAIIKECKAVSDYLDKGPEKKTTGAGRQQRAGAMGSSGMMGGMSGTAGGRRQTGPVKKVPNVTVSEIQIRLEDAITEFDNILGAEEDVSEDDMTLSE